MSANIRAVVLFTDSVRLDLTTNTFTYALITGTAGIILSGNVSIVWVLVLTSNGPYVYGQCSS